MEETKEINLLSQFLAFLGRDNLENTQKEVRGCEDSGLRVRVRVRVRVRGLGV